MNSISCVLSLKFSTLIFFICGFFFICGRNKVNTGITFLQKETRDMFIEISHKNDLTFFGLGSEYISLFVLSCYYWFVTEFFLNIFAKCHEATIT